MSEQFKEDAKKELLCLGEEVAAVTVKRVFNIAKFAIKDSESIADDMLLPVLPKLEEIVLHYVDQISPDVKQGS